MEHIIENHYDLLVENGRALVAFDDQGEQIMCNQGNMMTLTQLFNWMITYPNDGVNIDGKMRSTLNLLELSDGYHYFAIRWCLEC